MAGNAVRFMFRSGVLSRWYRIPADVLREFLSAESKGNFYRQQIRGRF